MNFILDSRWWWNNNNYDDDAVLHRKIEMKIAREGTGAVVKKKMKMLNKQ